MVLRNIELRRSAGPIGETETPIQNGGGSGWTGAIVTLTRGWTSIVSFLPLRRIVRGARLSPAAFKALFQILGLPERGVFQIEQDVVLLNTRLGGRRVNVERSNDETLILG